MARIHELAELLKKAPDEVFIQPHNVPDPDAIAASFGLQVLLAELGVKSVIVYEQDLEKANSRRMLQVFGIEMFPSAQVATLGAEDWTVLVDVQKENSNLTDLVTDEVACIDHHIDNGFSDYQFQGCQNSIRFLLGNHCRVLAGFRAHSAAQMSATALIYGIMSDTSGLSRGVSIYDIEAYYRLYGRADMSKIVELNNNSIDISVLKNYSTGIRHRGGVR